MCAGVSTVEFLGIARIAAPYLSGGANRTGRILGYISVFNRRPFASLTFIVVIRWGTGAVLLVEQLLPFSLTTFRSKGEGRKDKKQ